MKQDGFFGDIWERHTLSLDDLPLK